MRYIYSFIVFISWQILKLVALVNPKISQFVSGRKEVFDVLKNRISETDKVLWIHAASLGEYEQGLPILERLKLEYPTHKILLTFFSPSGYEVKKDSSPADITTYLPIDTPKKAAMFLDTVKPSLAIFIKYEIWPNYLHMLNKRKIPALLISARFKPDKIFFKSYGGFMRSSLSQFSHIFVQDDNSYMLLKNIGIEKVSVAGDTRLDRVLEILEQDNSLGFMDQFQQRKNCLVAGSTWPEDEKLLVEFINNTKGDEKFVIAPHNINGEHIQNLKKSISKKTLLYTDLPKQISADIQVIIIDTIGLLTKIYSYANIAYVGGGFATGLHNTLEPAVFGIPVIIGPNHKGFLEVEDLVQLGGILPIKNQKEFNEVINQLFNNAKESSSIGAINSQYILNNKGASIQIMEGIRTLL